MSLYLFGSHLIKKHFPDFRQPNDIDWVTNDVNIPLVKKDNVSKEEHYYIPFSPSREMTPDEIYTLKVSHAIYDIHWKKTMSDIRFLQIKGCRIIPEFLYNLRNHWIEVHGEQKRTDFEVEPGDFFDDRVKRKLSHDDLHTMINPNPTYKKMIINDVNPNIDLFMSMSEEERKEVLFEESFVISIERYQNKTNRVGYQMAQQSLVTRLHPVWISDIIIQNWNKWYWNPTNSKFFNNYINIKNKEK